MHTLPQVSAGKLYVHLLVVGVVVCRVVQLDYLGRGDELDGSGLLRVGDLPLESKVDKDLLFDGVGGDGAANVCLVEVASDGVLYLLTA